MEALIVVGATAVVGFAAATAASTIYICRRLNRIARRMEEAE